MRSENPATRRLIIESLEYWVREYHVDGFRFDLAAGIDKETLVLARKRLPKHVILISEPWTADWNRKMWEKGDYRRLDAYLAKMLQADKLDAEMREVFQGQQALLEKKAAKQAARVTSAAQGPDYLRARQTLEKIGRALSMARGEEPA